MFETRYFVLAYLDRRHGRRHEGWLHDEEQATVARLDFGERELLGQVVFDDEGWWMTIPRFSFRDYIGMEHLPRAASFPGPHRFVACECPACRRYEEKFAAIRAQAAEEHQSINPPTIEA